MPPADLWRYLESHRTLPSMPTSDELRRRFGEPDQIHVTENTVNPSVWGVTDDVPWYARYTDAERQLDGVRYDEWIYFAGSEARSIQVLLRKDSPVLLGWMWFEDVPEGEEQGPPGPETS